MNTFAKTRIANAEIITASKVEPTATKTSPRLIGSTKFGSTPGGGFPAGGFVAEGGEGEAIIDDYSLIVTESLSDEGDETEPSFSIA